MRWQFLGIISNPADSLFEYHQPGESWNTYYDPDFTPLFGVEFSDPTLENEPWNSAKVISFACTT